MRILQVIAYFGPKFGGDVNVCYNLSKQLAGKGHEVTILTSDFGFDSQYAENIGNSGVHVICCEMMINWGLFIYSPLIQTWLRDNIKNFDVIHMHNFRSYQNNVVVAYARKNNIPYIIQAHGSVLPDIGKRRLKILYDIVWGNRLLKNAARLVAVSKTEKIQYHTMGIADKRIDIIPNGIDVSEYEPPPRCGEFRKKMGFAPDEKIILYLGRLHKSKGIGFLLDGFASLLRQNKNVKLVIAGPNDGFFDILAQQVKNYDLCGRVTFTGPLYGTEKLEALTDADILAYLGQIEIFGLVPFEAIMCGTPVIVTDNCGCGEIVKDQHCGYMVTYGDVEGLVGTIVDIFNNPMDAKGKVIQGQKYIRTQIAWEKIVSKFEDLYLNCRKNS
jgi:glycosyltransferase involved in cell wall biosynthesis